MSNFKLNKKRLGGLFLFCLIFIFIYFDQSFKPQNIEQLREIANSKAQSKAKILPPKIFTTDGCSLWFNKYFLNICIEHDMAYWKGGSSAERKIADIELKEKANQIMPFIGNIIYLGVRIFGHPLMPVPWRWGYGFEYLKYNNL
jgi:hypothetical protein